MCYVFPVEIANTQQPKNVFIASDHGGFRLKNYIVSRLKLLGYQVRDFGPWKYKPDDDYPDTLKQLAYYGLDYKEDVNTIQKKSFEYTEKIAGRYYNDVLCKKDVTNPADRNQRIVFSSTGWNHMVEKKRSLNELITRFFALPRVPYLLCKTEADPVYIKKIYQNTTDEYWAYDDVVEFVKVKVVLNSTNKGPVTFLSVMWKGSVANQGIKVDDETIKELSLACWRRRELSNAEAPIIPQLPILDQDYQRQGQKSTIPTIVICKNGVGVSVLANKMEGVRCALSFNPEHAKSARQDDDANFLALPADYITKEAALQTALAFLETPFSNEERHTRRLKKLEEIALG